MNNELNGNTIMTKDMRHSIRTIILLLALFMGGSSEAQAALEKSNIIIDGGTRVGETFEYTIDHGSVTITDVDEGTRMVTITVTPDAGYSIQNSDVVVQKLVDPAAARASRRAPAIADPLTVFGPAKSKIATEYTFIVPADYAGALVTVTFRQLLAATVPVTANPLIYTGSAQELVTLGTVVGTKFDSGTKLDADASLAGYYTKSNDVYTPCNADDKSDGTTIYYKPLVTYSDTENGTYSSTIPTGTNAGNYTVYYKYVADEDHADGSGSVTVVINKAPITSVELVDYVKKHTGSAISFSTKSVKAGEISVSSNDYSVSGDALTQTAVGTYTCTVTAKPTSTNFTGSASVNFRIVEESTVFINSSSSPSDLAGKYVLTEDISASVLAGLYITTDDFTGELDGNFHKIDMTGYTHALFNTINGGKVKNVMLDNVSISGGTNVGAICNEAKGDSRIYNCGILATSSIVKTDDDGYTEITSCSSTISGNGYVGGIVGLLDGSSRVINCFSYANVSGGSYVGGIVGYNNVENSASNNLKTMVMNCMFYGEVSGTSIAPIYNGKIITNDGSSNGVGNYNYFRLEASYVQPTGVTYNCALGAEDRYLQRFEFFRNLLNSHRELAGWWATGTYSSSEMMKWVLEPSQLGTSTPYPILKTPGYYPSVVNLDTEKAPVTSERNKGGRLGTLTVNIQMGDGAVYNRPGTGENEAKITTSQLTLNITDKDPDHFNFNYYKVQLPYYNDVGTKNYTGNRVVTGWKIVDITGGTPGEFKKEDSDKGYNFADRNCTNKDLYSVSGRIFNQGAYWDVPEGVTAITIQPYWAKCVYLADQNADKVYNTVMETGYDVPNVGGGQKYTNGNSYSIAGENQVVYTTIGNAIASTALFAGYTDAQRNNHSVYDYAIVLVGNYHHYYATGKIESSKSKPYTVTSIDLDGDNEPDYSYILRYNGRCESHPVRADFINIPGLGMAQKSTGGTGSYNFGIMIPKGWFESTNTSLFRFTQFEYEHSSRSATDAIIVQGGVIEQWVSNNQKGTSDKIPYIHVGGNVWFKEFHTGCHQDKKIATKHSPISVTGGDYDEFYLTGLYQSDITSKGDNAECYINGGRFGTVCGAAMEGIGKANGADETGNITWLIQNADIHEFYAGGLNAAKPVTGNLSTTIVDSHVDIFCGGPKFGDMSANKTVVTNATGCTFGTFFGAGYGGNSYSRQAPRNHNSIVNFPHNDSEGAGNNSSWNDWLDDHYKQEYSATYGGVSTQFSYQFLPMSNNGNNVARIFVDYVKFSLATCHNVTSSLTDCIITGNFYGGGSLGKVEGNVTSTLTDCEIQGSAFGAGYSASLPTVEVMGVGFVTEPYYYEELGTYRTGVFPISTTTYHWEHANTVNSTQTAIDKTDNHHVLYTTEDLTTLGTVTGTATLTINGTTTVAESVYGGGEESGVGGEEPEDVGNTVVTINNGTIGTAGKGGATHGNVYGGGKGKAKNEEGETFDDLTLVKMGLVKGNTNVTINGGSILHNVYGGGAFGSVGNFTFADAAYNTAHPAATLPLGTILGYTDGGTANITILGGTIGTTGKDNGMVFGSSRGDVDAPRSIQDRLAWVHDTHVTIGTSGQGTTTSTPLIRGSVYGSGENGHTYQNAQVDIHSGTIGIASGVKVTDDSGKDYEGAAYPSRGNVYGGGCGTDKYYSDPNDIPEGHTANDGNGDTYNPLAGIVRGDATVNIDGGHVVHNVYGAGAMGSVGTEDDATSGTTTITISGGQIGVSGTVGDGNVFGAARGSAEATSNEFALVRKETNVSVSGKASVKGNVYGGGELGCVGRYVISSDMRNFYWTDEALEANKTEYTYNSTGVCNVSISGGTIGTGVDMSDDGSFTNGNVFGAGKGQGDTFWCEKGIVYKANVNVTDGIVNGNVYGGGEVGRVETDATVKVGPDTGIGSPEIKGNVFGGGAGLKTHGYSALVRGNTYVTVQSSAKVNHNVYGGGQIAAVGKYYLVTTENLSAHPGLSVGMPYSLVSDELGICNVTVKGDADISGSVFGGGKGKEPEENLDFTAPETNQTDNYHTNSYDIDDHMPKRMMNDYANKNTYWEYFGPSTNGIIWEYFETPEKYQTFLETLGLTTQSRVNIEGNAQVNGNVYGGSESGFVQHNTSVTIAGGVIGTGTAGGNVFGGGLGIATFAEAGRVRGNATVTINEGTVKCNVYGGGEFGDVGTIVKNTTNYNYLWTNDPESDPDDYEWNETGVCTVTINGGTIGTGVNPSTDGTYANGNVYGAGKGKADTYWCEKAIVYKTNVTVTDGTINGTVYGGGEVGRVENDGITTIGKSGETGTGSKPYIKGNVFGAGAGVKTHGYSALLRGNSQVTVQGIAKVGHSVYGGGEIASVGRFYVDPATQLPTTPRSGGTCTVTIQGSAEIGSNGEGYVFGACKGVTPSYNYTESGTTYDYRIANFSKRMVTYDPDRAENPHDDNSKGSFWDPYPNENTENPSFVWEYFTTEPDYKVFLNTLALTSNTKVTIGGDASVNGSVFGGGERGITLGSVVVNVVGGNVTKDVYGGGALADSNAGNVTGYGTDTESISSTSTYTTTVNLLGGTVNDAYGGALGQKVGDVNGGTSDVEAFVFGDVKVNLNGLETSDYVATDHELYVTDVDETDGGTYYRTTDGCIVTGSVFGCNNINGTPKGKSRVHVFKTKAKAGQAADGYDVAAVFGGGNQADYVPVSTDTQQSTEVIIEGCDLTSIADVYGGGYGAAVPGTYVLVKGTKIIDNVFGGGYGAGEGNPGANVGIRTGKTEETGSYGKTGDGIKTAVVRLMAGKINNVFGGSNTQGNIRGGSSVKNTANDGTPGCCDNLDVGKIFGGGKSAAMYGGAEIVLGCMPDDWIEEIYAGADQADVGSDISLTLTSGKFGRVFGGNNTSGTIGGYIEVNIEENPNCGTPIIIGELYGGGNMAAYTVPKKYTDNNPNYQSPRVNVRAFTSIGNIYGGGLGNTAIVTGNPTVNINEVIVTDDDDTNHAYDPTATDTERPSFIDGVKVKLYPHTAGKMGVIGNVFGGGNAAKVIGNTNVNIGTSDEEPFESLRAADGTVPTKLVAGADIRGNVYGGGNQAEVTGDTNVVIGKETTTTP